MGWCCIQDYITLEYPFSKISQNNKDVIALAELLGRTAGSVGLKLANLASLDPELKKRNIGGMHNASKLDAIIFKEFYDSWDELSFESQKIRSQYTKQPIDLLLPDTEIVQLHPGIDKERETKIRIGQDFFRKAVVSSYEIFRRMFGDPDMMNQVRDMVCMVLYEKLKQNAKQ